VKSDQWRPSKRTEREYSQILRRVWEEFGDPVQVLNRIEFLVAYAKQAAARMITGLYFQGARTWREAARESGKTAIIYQALQREMAGPVGKRVRELIQENAKLISSFPTNVQRRAVASGAAAHFQAGGRAEEFGEWLSGVARSRAHLIARTEISKASAALTQAHSEELGIDWYVWETSKDQRTRQSHKKMQGVLIRFDDPPSPEALIGQHSTLGHYNAGQAPNCRCYAAPVIRFERLSWPHRVFVSGRIQFMTLAHFKLINERRAVA